MEGTQASWHVGNEIMLNLCRPGGRTGWVVFGEKETKEWKKKYRGSFRIFWVFFPFATGKNIVYKTGRNVKD